MFFDSQSHSTSSNTALDTTLAFSSAFPGISSENPLDSTSNIAQSQRMIGASQSLPTRISMPVLGTESPSRGRTPLPDPATTVPQSPSRGPTLVTDPQSPSRRLPPLPDPATTVPQSPSRRLPPLPDPATTVPQGPSRRLPPLPSSDSIALALAAEPDSTLGTALDLGYIRANSPKTLTGSVSNTDINDFYRFTVDTDSNLTLQLSALSADADVEIIRDGNFNSLVDLGEVITRSQKGGSSEEFIDLRGLAGSYYVRVLSYNGTNNTNYTLSLSAGGGTLGSAPEANNSLSQAYTIGTLNGNRNFSGFVSSTSDQNDFYHFNLGTTSNFKLVLSGLSQDADVEVVQDSNSNNIIDPGEVVKGSWLAGNNRESIDLQNLTAGDYFVRVQAFGTTNATDYNLYLLGQPI